MSATGTAAPRARPVRLTGLVLAGGASRRMGRDKARLRLDGERLVDRACRRLYAECDRVLVAPGDHPDLARCADDAVRDVVPGGGPLAGIVAGLEAAATPLVAVAAVDQPDLSPAVLRRLADRWSGAHALVPEVGGRLQPLHAVWSVHAHESARAALVEGERSPTRLLARLDVVVARAGVWGDLAPDGGFAASLNDPAAAEERGVTS